MILEHQEKVWTLPASRRTPVEKIFLYRIGMDSRSSAIQRSIEDPEWFWGEVCDFLDISFLTATDRVFRRGEHMCEAVWFEGAQINLAHACLAKWEGSSAPALIFEREDGTQTTWTGAELIDEVQRGAAVLRDSGVQPGDRVVLLQTLSGKGVISLLSVAWCGAVAVPVFSGFGVDATSLRIEDSEAVAVVAETPVHRRGREIDLVGVATQAIERSGQDARLIVWADEESDTTHVPDATLMWREAAGQVMPMTQPHSTQACDPVLIAYTSGTTGKPKGVVHTHAGLTVKLAQEAAFQLDIQPGDRVAWITDLGWIMSSWVLVGGLVNKATVICYSGAPDFPDSGRLIAFARRHQLTALGLAPTLVRAIMTAVPEGFGEDPLPDLLTLGSSGEAWTSEAWWWLFDTVGKRRIPIINFTGGTEVGACFLSASLLDGIKPLSVGTGCWGMAVDIWAEDGTSTAGMPGELVCTQPWPSMAMTVWGDHARFLESYFSVWPQTWRHGDRASYDVEGFWTLHGRSDDVMNIAGKRLGPVEVEAAALTVPEVNQAAAIGLPHPIKGEALALFVVLANSSTLTEEVRASIVYAVVEALGKAFEPAQVVAVSDLPRTRTSKTVRRAIRAIALGEDPGDLSTIENPQILKEFPRLKEGI